LHVTCMIPLKLEYHEKSIDNSNRFPFRPFKFFSSYFELCDYLLFFSNGRLDVIQFVCYLLPRLWSYPFSPLIIKFHIYTFSVP
jgi:hypothetical protein